MKNYFLWLVIATPMQLAFAQMQVQKDSLLTMQLQEVVVSDSRFKLQRQNSGKVIISINQKELAQNKGRSIAEIINTKSGIEVNGSRSASGQNLTTFVRGGNNRQVLVIIDGIPVSDPSLPDAEFDLRLLNTEQIERIEILKGAASTLYGNAAATAVINITTKTPKKEGVGLTVASHLGTNQSKKKQQNNISDFSNTFSIRGKEDKLTFLVSGGHQFTDGLSAALGEEPDSFSRIDGNVKLGYQFSEKFDITATTYYNKLKSDYDNGFPIEDADFSYTAEQSRFGLKGNYAYENGTFSIVTAYNTVTRSFDSNFPAAYDSESFVADVFNKYRFNNQVYTIVGIQAIEQKTLFSRIYSATTVDPYANVVYVGAKGINVNAGIRVNNHRDYGTNWVYNLNPSYRLKLQEGYLKIVTSYATSYIAPNLSQLFGPFGANIDLQPENNASIEAGVEYNQKNKLSVSAVYFNRDETDRVLYNLIDPDNFVYQYTNSGNTQNFSGVELTLNAKLNKDLQMTANYAFTTAEEELALRIPKHKLNIGVTYIFNTNTTLALGMQHVSEREDIDFSTFSNVTLDAFNLVNLSANHQFSSKFKMFFSVDNLFNEEYVEIVDFTTQGRNLRLGFQLHL